MHHQRLPLHGSLHLVVGVFLLAVTIVAVGIPTAAAEEREAPSISAAFANAPGAITVAWIHQGEGVYGFAVQLKEGGEWLDARSLDHTFAQLTLAGLQPETWYTLRVCAVYGPGGDADRECSEPEVSVRTQSPGGANTSGTPPTITRHEAATASITIWWESSEDYGFFIVAFPEKGHGHVQHDVERGGRSGSDQIRNLLPGRTYVLAVKGCHSTIFGSSCSEWSTRVEIRTALPPLATPSLRQVPPGPADHPGMIKLQFEDIDGWSLTDLKLYRNGVVVYDAEPGDGYQAWRDDFVLRANTEYTYKVCVSNEEETACSGEIKATPRLIPPTAPLDVTLRKNQVTAGRLGEGNISDAVRITGSVMTMSWRHADAAQFIPGQFLTIERQDRTVVGRTGAIDAVWRELDRLSANDDPTRHTVDLTDEIGVEERTSYRVCAAVPALGAAGTVCSQPVTAR